MRTNVGYIVFAIQQAKEAEAFGFTRNLCCRNLKIAVHHYWQNKTLGLHGQAQKKNIPRSRAALGREISTCHVEHVVPLMYIVNKLMDMNPPTERKVTAALGRYFRVLLVTTEEHERLNASGLRSVMPESWDGKSVWARYDAVGIKPIDR